MAVWRDLIAQPERSARAGWTTACLTLALGLMGLALLAGASGCGTASAGEAEVVRLAGSTTVEPVAASAAVAFMVRHPGVAVTVRGGGSTIGVKGMQYGALDLGMISRSLKKEELDRSPGLRTTVIGRDGVAVVVNRALHGAGVKQLTLEQIAAIWRGKVTNWRELGGPDLAIVAYDKELGRGTRDTFAKVVLGSETAPAPGTAGVLGENDAVRAAIAEQKGAFPCCPRDGRRATW